jgi:hypothetical protein
MVPGRVADWERARKRRRKGDLPDAVIIIISHIYVAKYISVNRSWVPELSNHT